MLTLEGQGFEKLTITGCLPDAYTAHLKLMWSVKTDERNLTSWEGPIATNIAQLAAMQQEQNEEEDSAKWENWDDDLG